ncbi:MAG: hypothetical protein IJO73_04830 [Clostridia bacterium]|nr:hypothetical protein [Clostridia bacterium]
MVYVDFTAGNKDYKLRLNTRNTVALEKSLGCNPIAIFGTGDTIPTVTTMVTILYYSLQQLNHGITLEDAYNIFDSYLEDGNGATDFITVILDIYRVSGIIKESGTEKN